MRYAGVRNRRKILCVFARYAPVYLNFYHAYGFFPDTEAFMVPQGILTIAAYLPEEWEVRVVDENIRPVQDADLEWADAVFVSGMHVQRKRMAWLAERAHAFGKIAVAGGPSVSARTSYHPGYDILHVGELGDATDRLIELLDASVERPAEQMVLTTECRVSLNDFPIPAYHLVDIHKYLLLSIQWSSGCPYTCDFCDIPALYGREPRMKSPERLVAELDAILLHDPVSAIFWVDDNLIGNKKAAKEMLPHIAAWQKRNGYRLRMSGECTINLAQDRELLALFREAYFVGIYFGIETPSVATLKDIDKHQNTRMPLMEAAKIINSYGIELQAGFIFGMDSDGPDVVDAVNQLIRDAAIPIALLNVLFALPKTPLWDKLEAEGRILADDQGTGSNVVFKLPRDVVINQWKKAIAVNYQPSALYERYRYNIKHTYSKQIIQSLTSYRFSWRGVRIAAYGLTMVFWRCGIWSNYKRYFWPMAWELMRKGRIDLLIYISAFSHHQILFAQDVAAGKAQASIHAPEPGQVAAARDLVGIK